MLLLLFALCWETDPRRRALWQPQLPDGCKVKEEPVHRVPHGNQVPGNLSVMQVVWIAVPALAFQPLQPAHSSFPLGLVRLFLHSTGSTWPWLFVWFRVGFFLGCCFFNEHLGFSRISRQDAVPFAYKTQELNLAVCSL